MHVMGVRIMILTRFKAVSQNMQMLNYCKDVYFVKDWGGLSHVKFVRFLVVYHDPPSKNQMQKATVLRRWIMQVSWKG
jgi:hypothetical protein